MVGRSVRFMVGVGAVVSLVAASHMVAQTVVAESTPRTAGMNSTLVNVDVQSERLESVVQRIAQQAGLTAQYRKEQLSSVRVTLHLRNVSVADAFEQALRGTNLKAVVVGENVVFVTAAVGSIVAQGGITGKVVDAKTKQGLRGATITLGGTTKNTLSGDNGTFRIVNVAPGEYDVQVRMLGYIKTTRTVTVAEGQTVSLAVGLEPSVNTLDQMVVTGTVIPTELKAVPNAITVITAQDLEARGVVRIDQLFRGDVPGLFAQNAGSSDGWGQVVMYSRGVTQFNGGTGTTNFKNTNPIKTYVDGIELADPSYLNQIDVRSIERIEIIAGPQAATLYGSNAINGVMQVFTKRGTTATPRLTFTLLSGIVQNNFSSAMTPQHDYSVRVEGVESRFSYAAGGSWGYIGPWTPSARTRNLGGSGGGKIQWTRAAADVSLRMVDRHNHQDGSQGQRESRNIEIGLYGPRAGNGLDAPYVYDVGQKTIGLALSFTPNPWFQQELVLGRDDSDAQRMYRNPAYIFGDSTMTFYQTRTARTSVRYSGATRIPLARMVRLDVMAGVDGWNTTYDYLYRQGTSFSGVVQGSNSVIRQPGHNTGGFFQGQFSAQDVFFLTYGGRLEWNPNYGAEQTPNFAPRFGVAIVHDFETFAGGLTAKLRGSFGRATRPPTEGMKQEGALQADPAIVALYGPFRTSLGNPDLKPEDQKGADGGLELYFGNRGTFVVTRYNQTVNNLIVGVGSADSVRSLMPFPPDGYYTTGLDSDGYGYWYQGKSLNVGNIRNEGWELQGRLNIGPVMARATYSFTKSRVIGIDPRFRSRFSAIDYPQYQSGASPQFLPEHTWAGGISYGRGKTNVEMSANGIGQLLQADDELSYMGLSRNIRLSGNRTRMADRRVLFPRGGYVMMDMNATQRVSQEVECVLQVLNLTDFYRNDVSDNFATVGRQTKIGIRVRL